VQRQFLSAFLPLRRLAVDKHPQSALLIFPEKIEILRIELSIL
jgi:hypothetical protein